MGDDKSKKSKFENQKHRLKLKNLIKDLLAAAMVVGIALWSVGPVAVNPARVADFGKDGWLQVWIYNQWRENFSVYIRNEKVDKGGLFDGNIFYPYKNVLAYSDMYFISGLLSTGGRLLVRDPAAAAGLVMGVGQVATMLLTYWWFKRLNGGNRWGAAAGAVVFGLSQVRWHYQVHMHNWSLQYLLLGSWILVKAREKSSGWWYGAGAAIAGLQMWEAPLGVYFAGLLVISNWLLVGGSKVDGKHLIIAGVVFGVAAGLPMKAYLTVSRELGVVRSIRDAAHGGLSLDELGGRFGSPGLFVLLLWVIIRNTKSKILRSKRYLNSNSKKSNTSPLKFPSPNLGEGIEERYKVVRWLTVVMAVSLILAMGPVVKWGGKTVKLAGKMPIPMPYAGAYYLVPGWQAFRVPSRWLVISAWAGAGLVAVGLGKVGKRGMAAAMLVAVAGGARLTNYIDLPREAEIPAVYKWLADQPGQVIAQLPTGDENMEIERMYYSMWHKKQMLGGYSGVMPKEREQLLSRLNAEFPSPETVEELKQMGVDYVIVDKENSNFQFSIFNQIPNSNELKFGYEDQNVWALKI